MHNAKISGGWSDQEEKRTILEIDTPVALQLGEGDSVRSFHDGFALGLPVVSYDSNNPISGP